MVAVYCLAVRTETIVAPERNGAAERGYLWESAAAAVRRAIVRGELKPGERVSEAQLAERLSVSRMPARDAIRALVKEGLLEQQHGVTIVGAAAGDVLQLFDARNLLESHAVRIASGRLSPAAERELRRAAAEMQAAAGADDVPAYQLADHAFHRALFEASGHRWLLIMWQTLAPTLDAAMEIELATRARPMKDSAQSHAELLDELLRGDTAAAVARLQRKVSAAPDATDTIDTTDHG
jgi:DNA-binding GntR family transcriptional regulator